MLIQGKGEAQPVLPLAGTSEWVGFADSGRRCLCYGYRDDAYFFLKVRSAFPGIPG